MREKGKKKKNLQRFSFVHESNRLRRVTRGNELQSFTKQRPTQASLWNNTMKFLFYFLVIVEEEAATPASQKKKKTHENPRIHIFNIV